MEETNDASFWFCSILVARGWLFQRSRGCCLATLRDLLGAPLPAKRSCRPGSLLVAHREEGHKTQLPGVQVAVWLDLAEPTPEKFWKGAVLDNSQPVANLNKSINLFLRWHAKYIHSLRASIGNLHRTLLDPGSIF